MRLLLVGPGSYNVFEQGVARDSFQKAYLDRTKGGFGSTTQRSSIFYNKQSTEGPSPGQYEVSVLLCSGCSGNAIQCVFVNQS